MSAPTRRQLLLGLAAAPVLAQPGMELLEKACKAASGDISGLAGMKLPVQYAVFSDELIAGPPIAKTQRPIGARPRFKLGYRINASW